MWLAQRLVSLFQAASQALALAESANKAAQDSDRKAAEGAARAERATKLDALVGGFELKLNSLLGFVAASSEDMDSTAEVMMGSAHRTGEQATAASGASIAASDGLQAAADAAADNPGSMGLSWMMTGMAATDSTGLVSTPESYIKSVA